MTQTVTRPEALTSSEAGALPWRHLERTPGVRIRTLWESPSSRAFVVLIENGAAIPCHSHADGEHHAFVLSGYCRVGDRVFDAGSYFHTPRGAMHDLRGEYPFGAEVLYVFDRGVARETTAAGGPDRHLGRADDVGQGARWR